MDLHGQSTRAFGAVVAAREEGNGEDGEEEEILGRVAIEFPRFSGSDASVEKRFNGRDSAARFAAENQLHTKHGHSPHARWTSAGRVGRNLRRSVWRFQLAAMVALVALRILVPDGK